MLGDVQFAGGFAQAAKHQHQGHRRPGNLFAAAGKRLLQEIVQAQAADEFQSQPRPAEVAAVLDADPRGIDFNPLRRDVIEELFLVIFPTFRHRLNAESSSLVELSEIGHDPLTWAALGTMRLHQRPIGVTFAVLSTIARANEHARNFRTSSPASKPKVFTTTPLASPVESSHSRSSRSYNKNPRFQAGIKYDKIEQIFCGQMPNWRSWATPDRGFMEKARP